MRLAMTSIYRLSWPHTSVCILLICPFMALAIRDTDGCGFSGMYSRPENALHLTCVCPLSRANSKSTERVTSVRILRSTSRMPNQLFVTLEKGQKTENETLKRLQDLHSRNIEEEAAEFCPEDEWCFTLKIKMNNVTYQDNALYICMIKGFNSNHDVITSNYSYNLDLDTALKSFTAESTTTSEAPPKYSPTQADFFILLNSAPGIGLVVTSGASIILSVILVICLVVRGRRRISAFSEGTELHSNEHWSYLNKGMISDQTEDQRPKQNDEDKRHLSFTYLSPTLKDSPNRSSGRETIQIPLYNETEDSAQDTHNNGDSKRRQIWRSNGSYRFQTGAIDEIPYPDIDMNAGNLHSTESKHFHSRNSSTYPQVKYVVKESKALHRPKTPVQEGASVRSNWKDSNEQQFQTTFRKLSFPVQDKNNHSEGIYNRTNYDTGFTAPGAFRVSNNSRNNEVLSYSVVQQDNQGSTLGINTMEETLVKCPLSSTFSDTVQNDCDSGFAGSNSLNCQSKKTNQIVPYTVSGLCHKTQQ